MIFALQTVAVCLVVLVLYLSLLVIWNKLLADVLTLLSYVSAGELSKKSTDGEFLVFTASDVFDLRAEIYSKGGES